MFRDPDQDRRAAKERLRIVAPYAPCTPIIAGR